MRWRVSLPRYLITLYTAGVLTSKTIHLHHHYSNEEFSLLDCLFGPTFFLYDIATWLIVYAFLFSYRRFETKTLSAAYCGGRNPHNYDSPPARHSYLSCDPTTSELFHQSPSLHVASLAPTGHKTRSLCFLGACLVFATAYSSAAEIYVYADYGGLCSWHTVIEITLSPRAAYTLMTQWASIRELCAIVFLPVLGSSAVYMVAVIQQSFPHTLLAVYRQARAFDVRIFVISMLLKILDAVSRPTSSTILLLASISVSLKVATRLGACLQRGWRDSSSPSVRTPHSRNHSGPQVHISGSKAIVMKSTRSIVCLVFVALSFLRPLHFYDISVTTPLSVVMFLHGEVPDQCPAGKAWPLLPRTPASPFLEYGQQGRSRTQIDHIFARTSIDQYFSTREPLNGFESMSPERVLQWSDWTQTGSQLLPKGYNSMFDSFKVSNHDSALLERLRNSESPDTTELDRLKVNHIIFFVMESTSWRVFPLRASDSTYQRIFDGRIPGKQYASLEAIAPTARQLFLGSSPDHTTKISDGGIIVEGAQTSVSYTLKSLIASHCGVSPLPVDFMRETGENANIYQPCLPHILKALDYVESNEDGVRLRDRHNESWKVLYSQSTHTRFDRQKSLLEQMGFDQPGEMLNKEEMDASGARYSVPKSADDPPVGFSSHPEQYLAPYFRDFIASTLDKQQHFFLSHLTTTTHYPWILPENWPFQKYGEDEELNKKLNALEYQDSWLKQLLEILIDQGIYNETLIVLSGDHGSAYLAGDLELSLPLNNPHVANFQIPLMFHHPMLSRIVLQSNISSDSILPTVLDILANSNSLSNDRQREFLRTLIPSYEGQSLLRPLKYTIHHSDADAAVNTTLPNSDNYSSSAMSFGLVNPGRSHIVVVAQDPAIPWRLSMPICHHDRFVATNINEDSDENFPVLAVTIDRLLVKVRRRWGPEAAEWFDVAYRRATEWTLEVSRRYGIDQGSPPGAIASRFNAQVKSWFLAMKMH